MSKARLFFILFILGLIGVVFAEMERETKSSAEAREPQQQIQGGTFGEYLSQKEPPQPEKETNENGLLAPVAKPVAALIERVGSAVEPFLLEKKIKDEKGETQATIKPKEGKVQVDF